MRPLKQRISSGQAGFTLAETAIVLVIVLILMGGLVSGLGAQMDARAQAQTEQTLSDVREALLGFAVAKGRLPCPAAPAGGGQESPVDGSGVCDHAYDGLVPGVTLGLSPVDGQGRVLDGWNRPIHFAVATGNANAFTRSGQMKSVGMSSLSPNLYVCGSGSGVGAANCGSAIALATQTVAVLYSLGRNGVSGGTSADERQNPNPNSSDNDPVFVSHGPTVAGSSSVEFDDVVVWVSPYVLYGRLLAAGQLP